MWTLTLAGLFVGALVVVSMALSRRRLVRLVGLGVLLVVAVGGLAATVALVGLAVGTPRSDGFGRYGLLFLAVPTGLVTWLAYRFFTICRDVDPENPPPSPLEGLARVLAAAQRRRR